MINDIHLFRIKAANESGSTWSRYKPLGLAPGEQACGPMVTGGCPMVRA